MWTAIVLAGLIVAGVGAYVVFAVFAHAAGTPLWLLAIGLPLVYAAVPLAFALVWFLLGWWFRAERPADIRLSLSARVHMFWREYMALLTSTPRMIFYRFLMRDPAPAPARLPVLLLHGVGCNAGVWSGFRRYLEQRDLGPVYALSYGPPLASIEHFAEQLAELIERIERDTGAAQVMLVAHSMGGLVGRAYLRRYGGAHVRRLITIGSPHHGSQLARTMFGQSLSEMRPASSWLADLNRVGNDACDVPVTSLWSWHDSMVAPQDSSHLDWADNIVLSGIAHNALLTDHAVWERVATEIARAGEAPTSESPASTARMPSVPGSALPASARQP